MRWLRNCCCGFGIIPLLTLLAIPAWLFWLFRSLYRLIRLRCREQSRPGDGAVPPWAWRQPDPLIYSQSFLMAQGMAVTWDNPDIQLELASNPGVPVDSHALAPDTDHVIVARVWNGSATAPAVNLPVKVSCLTFGIGTAQTDVGQTTVDLAVKGAAGCPAIARVPWRTPATSGHHCLLVELIWVDDAEPLNNIGQHNTNVKTLNSPRATFTFPVRNPGPRSRAIQLTVDSYRIPASDECRPEESAEQFDRRRQQLVARHHREEWPVPEGWRVKLDPVELRLESGASQEVTVDITAPDGYRGQQAFNIDACAGAELLGGVTLYVDGSG